MSLKFGEINSVPEIGLESVMPFGKYSGYLLSELLVKDPKYLVFCYHNDILWFNDSILNTLVKPVQYLDTNYDDDIPF